MSLLYKFVVWLIDIILIDQNIEISTIFVYYDFVMIRVSTYRKAPTYLPTYQPTRKHYKVQIIADVLPDESGKLGN